MVLNYQLFDNLALCITTQILFDNLPITQVFLITCVVPKKIQKITYPNNYVKKQ
jgi:hypothetical protein